MLNVLSCPAAWCSPSLPIEFCVWSVRTSAVSRVDLLQKGSSYAIGSKVERFHARRNAGGDGHHRDSDGVAVARRTASPRGRAADELQEQSTSTRACAAQLQ